MSFLEGCASSASFLQIPYPAMALNQAGVNLEVEMYNTMKVAPGYPADPLLDWVAEVAKWGKAPYQYIYAYVLPAYLFRPDQPKVKWDGNLPVAE